MKIHFLKKREKNLKKTEKRQCCLRIGKANCMVWESHGIEMKELSLPDFSEKQEKM